MAYDAAEYAAKNAHDAIDKMIAEVAKVRAELATLKTDVSMGGISQFEAYPYSKVKHYKSYRSPAAAKAALTQAYEESVPVAKRNEEIAAHNAKIRNAAIAYLKALGVPDTYRKVKSSRSWKTVEVTAEWTTALWQAFPVSHGWPTIQEQHKQSLAAIEKWEHEDAAAKRREEWERENAERLRKYFALAAAMASRYGLEPTAQPDDVFNAVIASDKYLFLAYWLQRNRGDWSDGYSYAEKGLHGFAVETPQDKAVYEEIAGLTEDWDGDGRCFRDCTWNYDRLFEIARERNIQACADYSALNEVRPSEY